MKLAHRTVSVMLDALRRWELRERTRVQVCDNSDWDTDEVSFGVNWAAIGTVTPEEAWTFADNLRFAIRLCEELNAFHATYAKDYDAADPIMETGEDFIAAREEIYGYIMDGRYTRIARWLESHSLPDNDYFDRREEN